MDRLIPPCGYMGSKRKYAPNIVLNLMQNADEDTYYYDLCCGSGTISIELVNQGVSPDKIRMMDVSSWGAFWCKIGEGKFDMRLFDKYLSELPERYEDYKGHLERLAREPIADNEAELYPILQAGAFGGRQVSRYGDRWSTEGFISYGNVRHYTPRPKEMRKRICALIEGMRGVTCYHEDVNNLLNVELPDKAVVYLDPPYVGMKGYKFKLDVNTFVNNFVNKFISGKRHLWVSEGYVLDDCGCKGFNVTQLFAKGLVGNVNGSRGKEPHKEYLNHYYAV